MRNIIPFIQGLFSALCDSYNLSRIKYQNQLKEIQTQEKQSYLFQVQLQLRNELAEILTELPPFSNMIKIQNPSHLGVDAILPYNNNGFLFCYRWNVIQPFMNNLSLSSFVTQLNQDIATQRQYLFTLMNEYPELQFAYPFLTKGFKINIFKNSGKYIIIGILIT